MNVAIAKRAENLRAGMAGRELGPSHRFRHGGREALATPPGGETDPQRAGVPNFADIDHNADLLRCPLQMHAKTAVRSYVPALVDFEDRAAEVGYAADYDIQ